LVLDATVQVQQVFHVCLVRMGQLLALVLIVLLVLMVKSQVLLVLLFASRALPVFLALLDRPRIPSFALQDSIV
jgi:hypothetical protein